MAKFNKGAAKATDLRRRAEELLRAKTAEDLPIPTEADSQQLLHELKVHQIELEMQNEELRQTRDEVEAALEMYTDLYDFAPLAYFTFDRNGVIRVVNLTGAALLGVERARLIGRRFGQFVAVEARPAFTAFLGKALASPAKEACELSLLKEGKNPLFVQIEAVAAGGQECRAAVIDISERRELEEKLAFLNTNLVARTTELEAANMELEAFNYTIAHDLRGPLTNINSYCQLIRDLCGNKLDEQCKGYVLEAYNGTLRMNRLIDALLNFSRLAHVEPRRETVDLSAMAHGVATELTQADPARRIAFRIREGISAVCDANLLRVVLDNLLGNAWKYTGKRKEAVIEFGTTEVDGKPAWFVRDNGAGFDMKDADKLFTPFKRLPGTEEYRGFGIGLATVARIIHRQGGRVWAEGEPGKGACFYFTLSGDLRKCE